MGMTILEIKQNENGSHNNQTIYNAVIPIPEGWALLPEGIATPSTENYPFADIECATVTKEQAEEKGVDLTIFGTRDEIQVVTKYTPRPMPEPEPVPEPTPAEKRENAYNTEEIVEWDGKKITVTAAAQLWEYYAAEGSGLATTLTELIAAAKADIRDRYPDIDGE